MHVRAGRAVSRRRRRPKGERADALRNEDEQASSPSQCLRTAVLLDRGPRRDNGRRPPMFEAAPRRDIRRPDHRHDTSMPRVSADRGREITFPQGHLPSDLIAHVRGLLIADFGVDWRTPVLVADRPCSQELARHLDIRLVRATRAPTIRVIGYSDCGGRRTQQLPPASRSGRSGGSPASAACRTPLADVALEDHHCGSTRGSVPRRQRDNRGPSEEPRGAHRALRWPRSNPRNHGRPASVLSFLRLSTASASRTPSRSRRNSPACSSGLVSTSVRFGGLWALRRDGVHTADLFIFGVPRPPTSTVPADGEQAVRQVADAAARFAANQVPLVWSRFHFRCRRQASLHLYGNSGSGWACRTGAPGASPKDRRRDPWNQRFPGPGSFVVLGLVHANRSGSLDDNHQVLVYCMRHTAPGRFVYAVYDPNYELCDVIRIEVQIVGREARVSQVVPPQCRPATPDPIRGIFKMPYSPKRPSSRRALLLIGGAIAGLLATLVAGSDSDSGPAEGRLPGHALVNQDAVAVPVRGAVVHSQQPVGLST